MEKKDETIICKNCGKEFIFTVRDQEFYEEKGFTNKPIRCKECRDARKQSMNNKPRNNRNSNFSNFRNSDDRRAA